MKKIACIALLVAAACGGAPEEMIKAERVAQALCDGLPASGCGSADPLIGHWHDHNGNRFTIDSSGNATIDFWVNGCFHNGQLLFSGLTRCGGGNVCSQNWVGHTVTLTGSTLMSDCSGHYTTTGDQFDDTVATGGNGTTGFGDWSDETHGWAWTAG